MTAPNPSRLLTALCMLLLAPLAHGQVDARSRTTELAPGVRVVTASSSGANAGFVRIGNETLVIDGLRGTLPGPGMDELPRYVLETSASGDRPGAGVRLTSLFRDARGAVVSGAALPLRTPLQLVGADRTVELLPIAFALHQSHAVVHVPEAGVLFVGELCADPRGDDFARADIDGWIQALDRLLRLGARTIVPRRGAPGGPELLVRQRRWLVTVRDAARSGIEAGKSLAEIRAALDLSWYEPAPGGRQDPARAIDAVYRFVAGLTPPSQLIAELGLREGGAPTRELPGWTAPRKVLIFRSDPVLLRHLAPVAPGVQLVPVATVEEALTAIADADAVIGFINADLLRAARKLRWVQAGSAGVERFLAIPELRESDIILTNAQRLYGIQIAEHAMAMLLGLTRGLDRAIPLQKEGHWSRAAFNDPAHPAIELRDKTLLVVGLGGIGTEVARLGHGLGMRVVATRNSRRSGPEFVEYVGLSDETVALAARADVVVNCTPLTPQTTGLFDASFFRTLKTGAYFINVGRGRSVVTEALVEALQQQRLVGAGLDVTDPEPLPKDHVLWTLPGVIITPHVSAGSDVRDERQLRFYRENLRRFVSGARLLSVVNKQRGYSSR